MGNISVKRNYKYDTMKFLLLFLVIVGHEMELFLSGRVVFLYKIIYTFHMPAFMFITGKFAKFDKKRILKRLCLPYIVFQILYQCFSAVVLSGTKITIQFTTPYWILWYLLAVIFYYALIPFYPPKESDSAVIVVLGAFALSILIGYEKTVGHYLTLSRFIVFWPFFLCGYYQDTIVRFIKERIDIKTPVFITLSLAIVFLGEYFIIRRNVPIDLLYGSYGYEACGSSAMARFLVQITAIAWIVFLCTVVPGASIPIVSSLGKNTMSVFILHGFVIKILGRIGFFHFTQMVNFSFACVISIVLFVCFGNPHIAKIIKKIFS